MSQDNLRHAQYGIDGIQIDDPQALFKDVEFKQTKNGLKAFSGTGFPVFINQDLIDKGAQVCDWGSSGTLDTTGSTGVGFSATLDSTNLCYGKSSLKCVFPNTTAQTFNVNWTPTNPVSLANLTTVQVPFFMAAVAGVNLNFVNFKVWMQTSDGFSIRLLLEGLNSGYQAGVWHTLSFYRTGATTTQDPMSKFDTPGVTLSQIKIIATTTGDASGTPINFGAITVDSKRYPGRVSIVADGLYASQYTLIYPAMKSRGLIGSLATIYTNIGQAGFMTENQMLEMGADGWEWINHTYNGTKTGGYVNSGDWPTAQSISADIRSAWTYFKSKGMLTGIGGQVWGFFQTFAAGTTQARQNLVRDAFKGAGVTFVRKSTPYDGDTNGVLTPISGAPIDSYNIGGAIQVTNTDTAATLIAAVQAAEARGEFAVITLHRAVVETATPASLEAKINSVLIPFFDYLKSRIDDGGIICKPFMQNCSDIWNV